MSDGSIKIGTELDTTGIEKGLNTIKNQNRRTFEQMAKDTGKSVEEIRELFHKTVERIKKEYAELNNGKLLDNANAHKKAYKELGLLAEKNAKEVSKQADKISDSYEKSANFIPTFLKKGFANLGSVVSWFRKYNKNSCCWHYYCYCWCFYWYWWSWCCLNICW